MKGKDENRNFIPFVSGTFGEVGAKYKNKYRSLTYNIKDPKNDGLFRRILLRDLSPIEVGSTLVIVCLIVRFIPVPVITVSINSMSFIRVGVGRGVE